MAVIKRRQRTAKLRGKHLCRMTQGNTEANLSEGCGKPWGMRLLLGGAVGNKEQFPDKGLDWREKGGRCEWGKGNKGSFGWRGRHGKGGFGFCLDLTAVSEREGNKLDFPWESRCGGELRKKVFTSKTLGDWNHHGKDQIR